VNPDPAQWSLAEAAEAITARRVSSREVVTACLARIEAAQPALNAFIAVEGEEALAAAEQADAELARGLVRGPLHGVPLAHKDMFYRAGRPCSCGARIRAGFVPDHTCTLLERLEAAGAINLGRLNLTEFATGPHGLNDHHGHCRNPWNPQHITGGSSSGAGAAVAARLVFGALGSDTGGSVRLPAAFCGVVGLKATHSRVSRYGMLPLAFSMDQAGPLARTARDVARLFGIVAGHDPKDPTSSSEPVPDYEGRLGRSVRGLRIGVPRNHYHEGIHPDTQRALAGSLEVFRALGAEVREVTVPDHDLIYPLGTMITRTEAAAIHRRWMAGRPGDYSPQVFGRLAIGLTVPATRYLDALNLRAVLLERMMEEVFSRVDVLHVPGTSFPAPPIEEVDVQDAPGFLELLAAITRCTQPINYLGLPSLAMPAGFSAAGLPVGFQLVGRPFGEARLLNLGDAYQRETDWHTRAPPVPGPLPAA
jgi:aspartyl-tRNA(Asn)/glutamyl-tRNA(Gln) amidotransferase subunit A